MVYKPDLTFTYTSLPTSQMHLSINEMYIIVYETLVMQTEIFFVFPSDIKLQCAKQLAFMHNSLIWKKL